MPRKWCARSLGARRIWSWYGWCIVKFGDFGVLRWFCDLVVCWVKNKNHGVWKCGWTQTSQMPPKWCGKIFGAKGIHLGMVGVKLSLVILLFWLGFLTWWCEGRKQKSCFCKTGWTKYSQIPPKWCGKSLGGKEIVLGMVGAKPTLVILVFWLDFVTWWCEGWKTKITILEMWLDLILTNASKVMCENFWSKRNWSWNGWC